LSTNELYQQEGNTYTYLLESTFTKVSIENLVPEELEEHLLYRNQSLAFAESRLC